MRPTELFKALADETRVRIALLVARESELCVCELTEALEQSQPKISRHLAQLRSIGLLQDRRQGQWVFYRLHPQLPDWVLDVLRLTGQAQASNLTQDLQRLELMGDRPSRTAACCD